MEAIRRWEDLKFCDQIKDANNIHQIKIYRTKLELTSRKRAKNLIFQRFDIVYGMCGEFMFMKNVN